MKFKVAIRAGSSTLLTVGAVLFAAHAVAAANPPVTADQKAIAHQVAQAGVSLSALAPKAPPSYRVQPGDTLWAVAKLFLKTPWRWPDLWGMNLDDIKNPHLIYPGQVLTLEKSDGHAILRSGMPGIAQAPPESLPTSRLSPRTRIQSSRAEVLPTLKMHLIEPFLAEPVIVDPSSLQNAARIVAGQEGRNLLTRGDRAYARGQGDSVLMDELDKQPKIYRIFREASALRDPVSGEVLGYEAQFVGKAMLLRSESSKPTLTVGGDSITEIVPATINIIAARQEIRIGDRLLPEPERQLVNYAPHAPHRKIDARVMSVYGNAVASAGQNQIVTINRGSRDGVANGQVLAILKDGVRLIDRTEQARAELKLPDERNGLLMVFRTFEKLSYALIVEITDVVHVGDRLVNPG